MVRQGFDKLSLTLLTMTDVPIRGIMKKYIYLLLLSLGGAMLMPLTASAHCPLCTAGAGLVAIGAYWLGVKAITIGVALGAFATAISLWIGRLIKKQFVPYQKTIIAALSWLLTLVPLKMLFADYASWYVNWFGGYGTLFNRTYAVNLFWVGAVIGTIIIAMGPTASLYFTKLRGGRQFAFQGVILSLALVVVASIILQFL